MAEAAENDLSQRKTAVQGKMVLANEVACAEDDYAKQLDDLDFAFNEVDSLLMGDGQIRAISTQEKDKDEKSEGPAPDAGGSE